MIAGTSRVEGPGLRLTIDDAPNDQVSGPGGSDGRILDIDLQQVVNGLWSAGAEAVSVNGERLTALTAIRGADKSITVNLVVPGLIGTPRSGPEPAHHAVLHTLSGTRGSPDDVAGIVRFLCGPQARYITGQTIHVNGGAYLG